MIKQDYLVADDALLGKDAQKGDGVAVTATVHLSHDGEQVPDALRDTPPQRPQEIGPLCCSLGRG